MTNTPTVGNAAGAPWRIIGDVRPLAARSDRPAAAVTEASVDAFERDGFVYLDSAFIDWVDRLRAGLDRNLADPDGFAFPCDSTTNGEPGRFFDSYCNWQRVPEYLSFVLQSQAASMAALLMRSATAQLFHDHAFAKEQGTAKATPWHHDLPYYCVDGTQTVSIYIALDDMPAETAVRFLPGSHRTGDLWFPRNFSAGTDYISDDPTMRSAPRDVAALDSVGRALRAGDAVAFDFRTLHGSGDAPITDRRRAFSTRWLGDDAVYVERRGETSPPLVGLGVEPGERLRTDWFPVLWGRATD